MNFNVLFLPEILTGNGSCTRLDPRSPLDHPVGHKKDAVSSQAPGRIQQVEPPTVEYSMEWYSKVSYGIELQSMVQSPIRNSILLWGRLQNLQVDLLFGSTQGSGIGIWRLIPKLGAL